MFGMGDIPDIASIGLEPRQGTPGQALDASLSHARALEQRVAQLERENEYLRRLLRDAGEHVPHYIP